MLENKAFTTAEETDNWFESVCVMIVTNCVNCVHVSAVNDPFFCCSHHLLWYSGGSMSLVNFPSHNIANDLAMIDLFDAMT